MKSAKSAVQGPSGQPYSKPHASAWKSGFIASPVYDLLFFILSPLLALTIILSLDTTYWGQAMHRVNVFGQRTPLLLFFIGTWTYAHLFAVVFRSHANPVIFKRFWPRFAIVPVVLFLIFFTTPSIRAVGLVVATFWDVYHTSMQNFGFCRIYDSKLGNPPEKGRWLDIWMNLLVYIGPIFLGLSFKTHFGRLLYLRKYGWNTREFVTALVNAQEAIATGIMIVGAAFVAYYIYAYWRMSREGIAFRRRRSC